MKRPNVLSLAMVCGIGAFCWTMFRGGMDAGDATGAAANDPQTNANTQAAAGPLGRHARSIPELRANVQNDASDYWSWMRLGQRLEWAQEDAAEAWMAVLKITRSKEDKADDFGRARYAMGVAAKALGKEDEAEEAFGAAYEWYAGKMDAWSGRTDVLARFATICLTLGKEDEGRGHLKRAAEQLNELAAHNASAAYNLACYTSILGDGEAALRLLKHAAVIGYDDFDLAEHDEQLEGIRESVDFPLIMERMRQNASEAKTRGPY